MATPVAQRAEELAERFDRRNRRPLVGFVLGACDPLRHYRRGVRSIPTGPVAAEDIVVSRFLEDTEQIDRLHEDAGGDLIAHLRIVQAFEHVCLHLYPARHISSEVFAHSAMSVIKRHAFQNGVRNGQLEPHDQAILAHKPLLIWIDRTEDGLKLVFSALSPEGLDANIVVESPEQSRSLNAVLSRP